MLRMGLSWTSFSKTSTYIFQELDGHDGALDHAVVPSGHEDAVAIRKSSLGVEGAGTSINEIPKYMGM
jgi:hypothetical protein